MADGSTYAVADRVAAVADGALETGDLVIYAARLPDGPPLILRGPAALLWTRTAAGTGQTAAAIARATSLLVDAPAEQIQADVLAFLDDLVERHLLVRDDPPAPSPKGEPA